MPDTKDIKKACITAVKASLAEHKAAAGGGLNAIGADDFKKHEKLRDACEDEIADFAKSYAWAVPVAATLGTTTLLAAAAAVACYMRAK